MLTGEPIPVEKVPGDHVTGGTVNGTVNGFGNTASINTSATTTYSGGAPIVGGTASRPQAFRASLTAARNCFARAPIAA